MTDLLKLAERCEQATGPDRELDAEVAKSIGWRVGPNGNRGGWNGQSPEGTWKSVPRYTASLDAAMTLVPDRHCFEIGGGGDSGAIVWDPCDDKPNPTMATTPALALCAAALRARAASAETPKPGINPTSSPSSPVEGR